MGSDGVLGETVDVGFKSEPNLVTYERISAVFHRISNNVFLLLALVFITPCPERQVEQDGHRRLK